MAHTRIIFPPSDLQPGKAVDVQWSAQWHRGTVIQLGPQLNLLKVSIGMNFNDKFRAAINAHLLAERYRERCNYSAGSKEREAHGGEHT